MVKKKGEQRPREVTKHQLSRWQQQQKRQRIVLGSGIFIIVAALVIVGAGWYIAQYQPLHQIVIRVNDTEFDMNYYIKMLKNYGRGQPVQYMQFLADDMVRVIEENELARQGAMKFDISISDREIDEEFESRALPLSKDYRDLVRTEMLLTKLHDEYFEQEVPQFAEQRHIMAMFLESESQAVEIRTKLESGESFAELAGELSLDDFSKDEKGDLGWRPEGVLPLLLGSSIPDEHAFGNEVGTLSQPRYDEERIKNVGYWLVKVLEKKEEPEEAHVQAILLGSQEQAQSVQERLGAGEDFAALAKELSQHEPSKESDGDLGWLTPGIMGSAFDEFVFSSEPEMVSESIRDELAWTKGGYWLVKVLGEDDYRQIEDDDRDLLKSKALNKWFASLWDDPENKVEDYLDEDKKSWAISRAIKELE